MRTAKATPEQGSTPTAVAGAAGAAEAAGAVEWVYS